MVDSTKRSLRQQISKILEMDVADIASLPALYRHATHLLRFCNRVLHRFIADKCIQRASALAYATLLAIVPMVALIFSVFTSFQAFDSVSRKLTETLLEYLLPTSQQAVQGYLSTVTDQTTALSVFGVLGLLFTATALLNTVEEAFNAIWRITRARALLSKFITFWATLTLAPILIGASISITSYFAALPVLKQVAEGATYIGQTPFLVPWLMSSLAMATLYAVLPNTSVPFRFAMVGGMVAGALFEWAKFGFAFFVTEVANYERLYGALSTLPIFLIWLYLVWVIVLIGSEITFCLQHPEQSHRSRSKFLKPGMQQFYSHLIILRAAQAMQKGEALSMPALLEETDIPDNIMQEWLDRLCQLELLRETMSSGQPAWVLGRDADRLSLFDIFQSINATAMVVPEDWQETSLGRRLHGLYFRMGREQTQLLKAINMRDLVEKESEETDARMQILTECDT
jgi:membrane protein